MVIAIGVIVGTMIIDIGKVQFMLLRDFPLHTSRKALFVEVETVGKVVAKLIRSVGSPMAMTNVVCHLETRTQVMLMFAAFAIHFRSHSAVRVTIVCKDVARVTP